jgi:uncharacterized repeat protein (TIGR03803 family)
MRGKRFSIGLRAALASFTVTVLVTSTWAATNWNEKVLHSFCNRRNCADGYYPYDGLIFDASGNLYGTTYQGGTYGYGTVFELTPTAGGGWAEKVLHGFNDEDGYGPFAGLIFDAAGNLYGTTTSGGAFNQGTVFELTPTAGGGWTEQVLYSFCSQTNCTDGAYPLAGLIFDAAGNLYGATYNGGIYPCGAYGCGTVFELSPTAGGGWTETVLHSFGNGTDGAFPYAGLIFDAAGNLYGTTTGGGTYRGGTVFQLTPTAGGGWAEQVLYSFCSQTNCTDGGGPGGLIFDAAGNLYGTTGGGGAYGGGTVFELSPTAGGGWTEKVLHSFNGTDGTGPSAVIFDAAGNLYGTTEYGGAYGGNLGDGTVFELTPTAGGGWTEKVLHSFGNGTDGAWPLAGLIIDAAGNLYGMTWIGGDYGGGTVFALTPVYPCVPKRSHTVSLGEIDVLPAERRDVLEQGGTGRP